MKTQLNCLKEASLVVDEVAVYCDNSVLALVKVQKVVVESKSASFVLKPQRGKSFGLAGNKSFAIVGDYDSLSYSDGCYWSVANDWLLETNFVRVVFLARLLSKRSDFDEVFSAIKMRHVFYDEEMVQLLSRLFELKKQIKSKKVRLARNPHSKGQAWGGAGVMVISNDEETVEQYSHVRDVTVVSANAAQIGGLFRRVGRIIMGSSRYNYLSKHQFWVGLAQAAMSTEPKPLGLKLDDVCERVIMRAAEFLIE